VIALYAEWMKMNAVVLNVNYALTAIKYWNECRWFPSFTQLLCHAFTCAPYALLHDYVVVFKQDRDCRSMYKHNIEVRPLDHC